MRVVKTEVLNSDTGEIISEKVTYGVNNGGGWVICYRKASEELASRCDSAITFRVFHLLVSRLDSYEVSGVVCTRRWLMETLHVSRKSIYTALQWLIANDFIIETERDGCSEFFFNPSKVTIGRDKSSREKRWRELKDLQAVRDKCLELGIPFPLPRGLTLDEILIARSQAESLTPIEFDDGDLVIVGNK